MANKYQVPLDVYVHSNPAMAALVLYWTSKGYAKESVTSHGLLFPWGILALATVCSSSYRERIPKTTNARLTLFFNDNPEMRFSIPSMLIAWKSPFWEGLRYGVANRLLDVDSSLRLSARRARLKQRTELGAELERVGERFGRLIAREGNDNLVASALGIGFEV